MKLYLTLLLITAGMWAYSQDWEQELNTARKLYQQGKYKEALKYYKSAEKIAPNNVDLSEEKGQTAYRAQDFKTASECYQRQVASASNVKNQQRARTNLGESRMKLQDYQGAIDTYKEILRVDPTAEKARQRLMEAQRMLKQQQEQQSNNQKNQEQKENKNSPDSKDSNNKNQNDHDQSTQTENSKQPAQKDEHKLQDKETERKLNELSKQELNTKKRLDGSKGTTSGKNARKDW